MTQQIKLVDNGAREMRVLEALTPLTGTKAPDMNADYIGQIYVKTGVSPEVYISVAVGSSNKTDDWKKVTLA